MDANLAEQMRARAKADHLPADHDLYTHASSLEKAYSKYLSDPRTPTVQSMLGAWARARRVWCEYTGFPLI